MAIASLLLDADADIELGSRLSPLNMAAAHGHVEMLRLLLSHGADLNRKASVTTALMVAARNQHIEAVDVLLQAGAHPNGRNINEGAALFEAVGAFRVAPLSAEEQDRALKIVQLLVQPGANVNARTAGQSALQRARALKAPEIAAFLVASGAKD